MARFRTHDWDIRPDGNGFIWRVFGEDGEPAVVRQGWAGTRARGEELAMAAIINISEPAGSSGGRRPLFSFGMRRGRQA